MLTFTPVVGIQTDAEGAIARDSQHRGGACDGRVPRTRPLRTTLALRCCEYFIRGGCKRLPGLRPLLARLVLEEYSVCSAPTSARPVVRFQLFWSSAWHWISKILVGLGG